MTGSTQDIRTYMKLMESGYVGAQADNPNVNYQTAETKGEITKVIATLSSFDSGKYSRLAQNIKRMQTIAQQTLELESAIKSDARETIQELFNAEDVAYTRVVETVSFTLQLTKNPKAATTVKYAEVLSELEQHLTPELIMVLESIKKKFSQINEPKPPSLSHKAKADGVGYGESVQEGFIAGFFKKYLDKIMSWGQNYDSKLAKLKSQLTESTSPVKESIALNPNTVLNLVWTALHSSHNTNTPPLEILGGSPKGSSMQIRAGESVFDIGVKQIT